MIEDSLRAAPIINKDGYSYVIHPLTDGVPRVKPDLLYEWTTWAKQRPELEGATLLLAPEAMGIPGAVLLSQATGIPFVVARKRKYDLPGETIAYCETGYGQSCIYLNDIKPGDKVVVVDDLISTGGTLNGILAALSNLDVEVLAVLAVVDKNNGAQKVRSQHEIPVLAMHKITVGEGKIAIDP